MVAAQAVGVVLWGSREDVFSAVLLVRHFMDNDYYP
jgi:hypothetical protein